MDNTELYTPRVDLGELRDAVQRIRNEVGRMIVGQQEMIDLILAAILADGHVLIEGVPGVAKTMTAKLVARTIAADFSRIQFTPDLMPSDILGTSIFNVKSSEFEFRKGPIFSNLVLIDEINRSPAKTQAALFEVMEERQVTVDGTTYIMAPPFMVLATQNPIDHEGTYRLPEAQLDRFIFKIEAGYPTCDEETRILEEYGLRQEGNDMSAVGNVVSGAQVNAFRAIVRSVHCDPGLLRYIASIVGATRNNNALYLGASPRASIAVMMGSRAMAAMAGRDFVSPDDVRRVVEPVLRHRLLLTPEREMEGTTIDDVVRGIVEKIEVPR